MPNPPLDFTIARLGDGQVASPMRHVRFTEDDERLLYSGTVGELQPWLASQSAPPAMEVAGPRRRLFFDPAALKCGIVTCGGLCPGLNDVIRAIVLSLHHHYGVATVYGLMFMFFAMFPHMNIRLELGPLTRLILGPQLHRIHHSVYREHFNTNFAGAFPVWDLVFGTYRAPGRGEFPPTGLPETPGRPSPLHALLWPMYRSANQEDA